MSEINEWRGSLTKTVPLLALFGCAWVSDVWPALTIPALIGAVGVTALAFLMSKRRKAYSADVLEHDTDVSSNVVVPVPPVSTRVQVSHQVSSSRRRYYSQVSVWSALERELVQERYELFYGERLRLRTEIEKAKVRTEVRGYNIVKVVRAGGELRQEELRIQRLIRPRASEATINQYLRRREYLAKYAEHWELTHQDEGAFKIDAGAFVIEHFAGQTNIRILDASRVTVEGKDRGSSVPGLPPEARTARYH